MSVILFFCPKKVWANGVTAFTAHLSKALTAAGCEPTIIIPSTRPGVEYIDFGEYDVPCVRADVANCLSIAAANPSIITVVGDPQHLPSPTLTQDLESRGARIVIHDLKGSSFIGVELGAKELRLPKFRKPPILIRQSMKEFYPEGSFIRHPYESQRFAGEKRIVRSKFAVCTARISTEKRIRLILQANRLLPKRRRVDLQGAVQRMTAFGLSNTYKDVYEMPQGNPLRYPQTFIAPIDVCRQYFYSVDLSKLPFDGGGTQYTQLEAIDAGCVPVMHADWFDTLKSSKGSTFIPGKHVLTVDSPAKLAATLKHDPSEHQKVVEAGRLMIRKHHAPRVIGNLYRKELGL